MSRKFKKTKKEKAAEKQVAIHLGLAYPRGFVGVRKDIKYMYGAVCCPAGDIRRIYAAYNELMFKNACTHEEVDAIIRFAIAISSTINVPRQDVANAFAPYSGFNGGYFTRTSGDIGILFGIALMAQMVHVLPTYRQQGSAQQQGFALLLANAGVHGDVLDMLAQQYTTDTPLDSAEAEGKKLAEQLNELDGAHLLQVLYSNLAGFAKRAKTLQPPGYSPPSNAYDRSKFDNTRPKGEQRIAYMNGAATVSVTLVQRTDKPGHDGLPVDPDHETKKLTEIYGDEGSAVRANYKPFTGLRDSHALDGNPGAYVETHRASLNVPSRVTPEGIVDALRSMLHNQPLKDGAVEQDVAPKLKEFLDNACVNKFDRRTDPPPHPFEWGVYHQNAYLGVRYGGSELSIGKEKPRCRSVSKQNHLNQAKMSDDYDFEVPQRWLWLGAMPHDYEVANLMCPPWHGYNVGTVEFFLLLSDRRPQDVLNITKALDVPLEIAATTAGRAARRKAEDKWRVRAMPGQNPLGRKKRSLNPEEVAELGAHGCSAYNRAYKKYKTTHAEWYRQRRARIEIQYPRELGVWPADHPAMARRVSAETKSRAEEHRKLEIDRATIFENAKDNFASVVAAEPGGLHAAAAATEFAAAAAAAE